MKKQTQIGLALTLVAVAATVFTWPQIMVAPGPVIADHQHIAGNCFACHAPLLGTSSDKCISCHKPTDIGRVTTRGAPIGGKRAKPAFHQSLKDNDCMACHSDHAGVMRLQLRHKFEHAMLAVDLRTNCSSCHSPPQDPFHAKAIGQCSTCHRDTAWLPATFDHSRYFLLDRDHNVACETCHRQNNYQAYTCYGCHEHTRATIRREHVEEGIRDFEQCTECHRSADEDGGREQHSGERD